MIMTASVVSIEAYRAPNIRSDMMIIEHTFFVNTFLEHLFRKYVCFPVRPMIKYLYRTGPPVHVYMIRSYLYNKTDLYLGGG